MQDNRDDEMLDKWNGEFILTDMPWMLLLRPPEPHGYTADMVLTLALTEKDGMKVGSMVPIFTEKDAADKFSKLHPNRTLYPIRPYDLDFASKLLGELQILGVEYVVYDPEPSIRPRYVHITGVIEGFRKGIRPCGS
jgi:hypothetical protein